MVTLYIRPGQTIEEAARAGHKSWREREAGTRSTPWLDSWPVPSRCGGSTPTADATDRSRDLLRGRLP